MKQELKDALLYPRPEVSLCMVTCATSAERADVIMRSFRSLIATTEHLSREILIWDNAGDRFYSTGLIRAFPECNYLTMSPNIGPYRARRRMYYMARGKYLMFTDDDVEFLPGWYEHEKKVLDACPMRPCVVGGVPFRQINPCLASYTMQEVAAGRLPIVRQGEVLGDEYLERVGKELGLGAGPKGGKDYLLGVQRDVFAWAHGSHMQFLTERDKFPVYPETENPKVNTWAKEFDLHLTGYRTLGLTTYEQVVRHIGEGV